MTCKLPEMGETKNLHVTSDRHDHGMLKPLSIYILPYPFCGIIKFYSLNSLSSINRKKKMKLMLQELKNSNLTLRR